MQISDENFYTEGTLDISTETILTLLYFYPTWSTKSRIITKRLQ